MAAPTRIATPVLAGVVTGLVGFTSSFAVVLAGLGAVGATSGQAASGLMIVSLTMGAGCVAFSLIYRRPITMAWSTPGAALLASAAVPDGGFATAVGAFAVTGVLLAISGFVPAMTGLVRRIPDAVASAMLSGVLFSLCVVPFQNLRDEPALIGIMLAAWAVTLALVPRWAVPAALAAVIVLMLIRGDVSSTSWLTPHLEWTSPHWNVESILALSVPLYLVTMTSQNIPGLAVMRTFGYEVPIRSAFGYTGTATTLGAGFGGHAINLSAIAAALAAGPEAGPQGRRWIAGVTTGAVYILLGITSGTVVGIANAAPHGIFAAFAGLALISTFASSAASALSDEKNRIAGAVTFVVAASGITFGGIGAAFWALVAGGVMTVILRRR